MLPAVARSLGSSRYAAAPDLGLPAARRAVVLLVDGLGHEQLLRRGGHAPFLRGHLAAAPALDCGFPSTTATSMGSFGTGTPPGTHGLVGYEVLVPGEERVFNELSWERGPDPRVWQPHRTVFEELSDEGVAVTLVGPGFFQGSGLTTAALRGARFRSGSTLAARVTAAAEAVRASARALVYVYWGDLDKVGHVSGVASWEWGDELEAVDRAVAQLAARVPGDTAVHVTADHGMVDVPSDRRVDLAHERDLLAGVRLVGGEPRGTQLYCAVGAAPDVLDRWRARLGDSAWVASRAELVDSGWFGAVRREVLPRIGDVVAVMLGDGAVVDSERMRPEVLRLKGLHGSVTSAERTVPFVSLPPRTA
ncbi:MAG: nucleotide pyrophosphatase/phosphodiesterase family protein [Lapillicoccus sp.]